MMVEHAKEFFGEKPEVASVIAAIAVYLTLGPSTSAAEKEIDGMGGLDIVMCRYSSQQAF